MVDVGFLVVRGGRFALSHWKSPLCSGQAGAAEVVAAFCRVVRSNEQSMTELSNNRDAASGNRWSPPEVDPLRLTYKRAGREFVATPC